MISPTAPQPNDAKTTPALLDGREATPAVLTPPGAPQWLALGAVAGPALLVFAWVVMGLLRPDYAPMRQQISDLGVGANALPMNAAFVLSGLLLLGGVVGIFQGTWRDVGTKAGWVCMVLLALSPLGLVVVGLFTEASSTWVGHAVGAVLVFQTQVVGFLVTGFVLWRRPRWRRIGRWLLLASPLTLALVYSLFQAVLPGAALHVSQLGGLIERVALVEIHAWYVALGWLAFRRSV